jgi:GxxExxY protein
MPIRCSIPIEPIGQEAFHAVDRVMLGHAFAAQNEFGRFLREKLYQAELARRCGGSGMRADREVLIRVSFEGFSKDYRLDLLLDGTTVVEAKCVEAIAPSHVGQTLNYLLLTGTQHGSLINFRGERVTRRFVSTRLNLEARRGFERSRGDWPDEEAFRRVEEVTLGLADDVGLGLDLALYREAIVALCGGSHEVQVPIHQGDRFLADHSMAMLTPEIGLAVTAIARLPETRHHLQRLLDHTPLRGLVWINLPLGHLHLDYLRRHPQIS